MLAMNNASADSDGAEKTTALCGGWKITFNSQTRKIVDTDALKKAGIFEQYSRDSVSKVMRITKAK